MASFLLRKRWPGLLAAWASYLILLAPNSGLVRTGPMLVADRYSYLSTMGFFVLAAAGIASLRTRGLPRPLRRGFAVAVALLVACLIPPTWRLCGVWRNSESVWQATADHFEAALRDDPTSADAHHNLGVARFHCGRLAEAITQFRAALEIDPALTDTYGSLGQALLESGRFEEARLALVEAAKLAPDSPDFRGGLALVLVRLGRLDEARAEYSEALRREPRAPEWHAGLGLVLDLQGRPDEAAAELAEAARLNPDDPHVRDHLRRLQHSLRRR